VYPTGTQVQRQRTRGTLPNWGQSPIGECVFKQMSPWAVGRCSQPSPSLPHTHIHTIRPL